MRVMILFFALSIAAAACAQSWRPVPQPIPAEDAQLVYFPPTKSIIMLGGTTVTPDSAKTLVWRYQSGQWMQLESPGPGARIFFKGDLHAKENKIYMYAGSGIARNNVAKADLWTFDGSKWKMIFDNQIGGHDHHKMIYIEHMNAFLMYGGNLNNQFDTTTWLLKEGKFHSVPTPGPGIKYQYAMAYDKKRKKVVLYGGGENPDELWEFDENGWVKIAKAEGPGARLYHLMVYDENLKKVVLHGGQNNHRREEPQNLSPRATWTWDGKQWEKLTEANVFPISMTYSPVSKSVMAIGFDNGSATATKRMLLWELKNGQWTTLKDYGVWNNLSFLEKHLNMHPNDYPAKLNYASYLKQAGRYSESENVYLSMTHAKMPERTRLWFGLIDVLMLEEKWNEAAEALEKADTTDLKNERRRVANMSARLGRKFALLKETGKAFKFLHLSLDRDPSVLSDPEKDADLKNLHGSSGWEGLVKRVKG